MGEVVLVRSDPRFIDAVGLSKERALAVKRTEQAQSLRKMLRGKRFKDLTGSQKDELLEVLALQANLVDP